jgi:hypothetical protein
MSMVLIDARSGEGGRVYLAGFRITRSSQFRNGDDAGSEQIKRGANKQHFVLLLRREYQN